MRHLQFRNIENLRFIEQEAAHARDFGFRDDYSEEEREMYAALSRTAAGPPSYFLSMAVNMQQFALHWDRASIAVVHRCDRGTLQPDERHGTTRKAF